MIWSFGTFELDDRQFVLRRDGEVVPLRRKVFDVLLYLVSRSGALVTKEQLLANVWPNETILEAVVPQNIAVLRRLLGDSRGTGKVIQTVHGRGYRFVAKVETHEEPNAARAPVRGSKSTRTPFVGREQVMGELRGLLDEAVGGNGQSAMLLGEAGIGKTRIAEELSRAARERGVLVLEGHCQDTAGALPFRPWIKLLRVLVDSDASARAASAEIDADAARVLGEPWARGSEPTHADPQAAAEARFRLFDSVTALLARASRKQPLLLIFDDLHWADQSSLHLLRFVTRELRSLAARELRSLPIMLLGTTRPIERGADALSASLLTALLTDTPVRRIPLEGLSRAASAELIAQSLGRELTPAMFGDVFALTEGNPFYVHELLRLLNESEVGFDGERMRRELPRRIRDVIVLRLQRAGDGVERVLLLAAVIGRDFSLAVLEAIADLPRRELFPVLARASEARLLREPAAGSEATGWYEFSHALIQESLYASLPPAERVRVHERVGHALETVLGADSRRLGAAGADGGGAQLAELAYHFHRAAVGGDVARAVAYCRRAAEQAFAQLAFEQAVAQYRAALEALALQLPIDWRQLYELRLGLGSAQFRAGEDGNAAFLEAADVARKLGRPELLAKVVLAMAGWPRLRRRGRTDNPAFYPLLREALDSPLDAFAGLKAQLLCALVLNMPESTPLSERIARSREALALARQNPHDDNVLYDALLARLRLMGGPADTEQRLELSSELREVAERSGQKERIFQAHELRIQPLIALNRMDDADRELEKCAELADQLRLPRFTLQVLRFRLQRLLAQGRFGEIRRFTKQAVAARGQALASPNYMVGLFVWQSVARALQGDRVFIDRHIAALTPKLDEADLLRAHVALLHTMFNRSEDARRCYQPLLGAGALEDSDDEDWLMTQIWTAQAVVACDDRAAARALYDRLAPFAALNVTHYEWLLYLGACSHWLGALAGILGEWPRAVEHFEDALQRNAELGARPALADTCLEYARVLLRRDPANAHAALEGRAGLLLERSAEIATELQMEPLQRQIVSLRASLPLRLQRASG